MRDRKTPDDEYNRRLHIYAETPGLQQPTLVPASEKELNAPRPQAPPPTSSSSSYSGIQINPYARIPAANFVEEEEEEEDDIVDLSASRSPTGRASSSSHPVSSSSSRGANLGTGHVGGAAGDVGRGRDPIYAELDHQHSEDDRAENGGESRSTSQTANISSSYLLRTSGNIPNTSQNTNGERRVPPAPPAKRPVPLPQSSIAKKLDIARGGPNAKTIRTHTRLDASLEIPATPRPKPTSGADEKGGGGGIKLIRKVDRNGEAGQSTSSTTKTIEADTTTTTKTRVESSGIILTRVRSIDGQTMSPPGGQVNSEEETQVAMPVDPDLDAGTAIIKKKQRFRRNMIFIIAFLMILLIVVAAVIVSLVIVTKAGSFW